MAAPEFTRKRAGDYRSADGSFRIVKEKTDDTWLLQRHTEQGWRLLQHGFATLESSKAYLTDYLK